MGRAGEKFPEETDRTSEKVRPVYPVGMFQTDIIVQFIHVSFLISMCQLCFAQYNKYPVLKVDLARYDLFII